jgi:hypothetical protein
MLIFPLQKVPTIPAMDPAAEGKKLLGEAYFLRAWYYFNLVRMFGKHPVGYRALLTFNQSS